MTLQHDKKTVLCNICNHQLTFCHRSTSNLLRHVQQKHAIHYAQIETVEKEKLRAEREMSCAAASSSFKPDIQPQINEAFTKCVKYKQDDPRKKLIDECILDMIVTDMQPLSLVESTGFRKLIKNLDPRYDIVSRSHLTSVLLPCRYENEKLNLIKLNQSTLSL